MWGRLCRSEFGIGNGKKDTIWYKDYGEISQAIDGEGWCGVLGTSGCWGQQELVVGSSSWGGSGR